MPLHSFYVPTRVRQQFSCGLTLVTKQEFKDECNINNIVSQYKLTGIINHINQQPPVYADLPDDMDYQTSLATISSASDAFDRLPAATRRAFDNDPYQLLIALGDPARRTELEQLGILKGPATPQPPGNPVNSNPSAATTFGSNQNPLLPPGTPAPPAPPPAAPPAE